MTDPSCGRGGSPLQGLIIRGHQETMVSAIRCVRAIAAGPIYLKEKLSLHGSAEEISLRATKTIESMIAAIIKERPFPYQQEGNVTIFKRRIPEQSDWSEVGTLEEVYNHIRMLDAEGYPPAYVRIGSYKLEFCRASCKTDSVVANVTIKKLDE
jgi:methionyl-tRNA formyltransferase